MATQSPFLLLEGFLQKLPLPKLQPPTWVVDEAQRRVVLLLNHILMQEPEAMARLQRKSGQILLIQWRSFSFKMQATPAGLLDMSAESVRSDLVMTVIDDSPLTIVQAALKGEKPTVRIEGDVQLAAEVNWLTEHVRWDIEEDLARVLGDVPAHTLAQMAQTLRGGVRQFVAKAAALVPGKSTS